uniref:nucleoside recognition domain-containing protein n=1 Tax=Pararhizobium sp. IMCC3301 TaxID=3067904 RepID=UPI002740621D|nr:nucleoside recognition domain-containing protein [Pararhizobium sp. IMCC3301]
MSEYFKKLAVKSWVTFVDLSKVMIPVVILVRIAEVYGLVDAMGPALEPVMGLMGLPAETGIVWGSALLVGIYAGFGALPVLAGVDMNLAQLSILASIMLIAHALPIEQAIVKRTGVTFIGTVLLRFFGAVVYGAIVFWICDWFSLLQQPVDLSLFTAAGDKDATHWEFAVASAKTMLVVLVIIVVLFVALDISEKTGFTDLFTRATIPLIRLSGLNREIAPLTTIGVLLGLMYGGGLIIGESREKNFSLRAKTLALCWLSLSHGLIEDTGIMLALGANIWIILVGRLIFTLIVVRILATLWPRSAEAIAKEASSRAG